MNGGVYYDGEGIFDYHQGPLPVLEVELEGVVDG